ncbi:MAG TPA: UDP-2,3-diacylglucosamine diphosphatase [Thiothrix sp.]|nr:UDP-2,3-diacylglucosamine diphosphatase [Thiothrix sp.]
MKKTWFISDLHLDPSRPQLFTVLLDFLDHIEPQADALYILGDLFEFWVGDDLIQSPLGAVYLPILQRLKSLSNQGIALYFIQGNRDFLVRETFVQYIGAKLLPDTQVINLYGKPTLILHGDTLCTDDKGYQRMRALFRMKLIQKIYLSLNLENRTKRAQSVRHATKKQTQEKHSSILDVNQQAVKQLMQENSVTQMIHGHTHRPAIHKLTINGEKATRFVLSDWHDKASFIEASEEGVRLEI